MNFILPVAVNVGSNGVRKPHTTSPRESTNKVTLDASD